MSGILAFELNGRWVEFRDDRAEEPLLWILRDEAQLKGTKYGCGHGGCGACTVHIEGLAAASCNVMLKDVAGKKVTTIEGLAARPSEPVLRAWLAEQVPQCGYCQPGMIMAAVALLAQHPKPTDAEIDAALSGVLCRCGTYQRVRHAIHRAAEKDWENAPFPNEILPSAAPKLAADGIQFNPWIKIARDGTVIAIIGRSEMGQGVSTALPMMIAEELEIPLACIRTEFAPADHTYDNPIIHLQITVGSLSMQTTWEPVRKAAAEVRERLIAAAALRWNVSAPECRAENGAVWHEGTGCRLDYGELAERAATLPVPAQPQLKRVEDFRVLGKPTARLDLPDHITGRTVFGTDIALPGMRVATVKLAPNFGAKTVHIDDGKAKAIPGVRSVFPIREGVAIVADDSWAALRGRDAVEVLWSGGDTALSSADITRHFRQSAKRGGQIGRDEGQIEPALQRAAMRIEAAY